jgi:hypothetical protein
MKKSRSVTASRLFTPRSTLAALGLKIRSLKILDTIAEQVKIHQKTIRHTPIEKLTDALIAILSGAHGLCEVNTRVRSDQALQRAFGRKSCAEQSVVQETFNACTGHNVSEMEQALNVIFRAHSRTLRHDYKGGLQLLDVDLTGMPCGKSGELALKGYFGEGNIRYGRQMCRVLAPHYEEVVVDRLFAGNLKLTEALQPVVKAAEETLLLDEAKRRRTVLRIDAGGGSLKDVNWLLERGYHVHCKDYSTKRAAHWSLAVTEWIDDPRHRGRQLGWVGVSNKSYVREVKQLGVRWRKQNGQRCHAMLLSTLEPEEVLELLGQEKEQATDREKVLVAYMQLYDERGGAIEIEIKESKQGLGITKRNKKRFCGQQMVMMLSTLAHNLVVWAKQWLVSGVAKLKRYGVPRMVRDVLAVSGFVEVDERGTIKRVVMNKAAPLARQCAKCLHGLLKREHVSVILGET